MNTLTRQPDKKAVKDLRRVILARCYELILAPDWGGNESASINPHGNSGGAKVLKPNSEGRK